MMMRQIIFLTLFFSTLFLSAQSSVGLSIGTSKSDVHTESLWYQQQFNDRFSLGLQASYGNFQYRFVDAKAVTEGSILKVGVPIGIKLTEGNHYRLDLNLTPSLRFMNPSEASGFANSTALEIDPNILVGIRANKQLLYHAGVMLRTVLQVNPTPSLLEQFPSAILLNGLSYESGKSLISLRTYFGPMSGAAGDSEKFFWQVSLGLQRSIGKGSDQDISFSNF